MTALWGKKQSVCILYGHNNWKWLCLLHGWL